MVNNIKTNDERTLSGIFRVTPNVSSSTVSFEFVVPDKSGNFSTGYGIAPSVQGYHGDFINIENISCYSVSSTLCAKVQFTSASTSEHVLQFIIRYTILDIDDFTEELASFIEDGKIFTSYPNASSNSKELELLEIFKTAYELKEEREYVTDMVLTYFNERDKLILEHKEQCEYFVEVSKT